MEGQSIDVFDEETFNDIERCCKIRVYSVNIAG